MGRYQPALKQPRVYLATDLMDLTHETFRPSPGALPSVSGCR